MDADTKAVIERIDAKIRSEQHKIATNSKMKGRLRRGRWIGIKSLKE